MSKNMTTGEPVEGQAPTPSAEDKAPDSSTAPDDRKPMDKHKIFDETVKKELGPLVCYKMKDVADLTIKELLTRSCSDLVAEEALAKYSDYFYWSIAYAVDHAILEIFEKYEENMED